MKIMQWGGYGRDAESGLLEFTYDKGRYRASESRGHTVNEGHPNSHYGRVSGEVRHQS